MCFAAFALFASSFIWNNNNVYIQLGYKGYGWQTLIIGCLLIIWIINVINLFAHISGTDLIQEYGKSKLIIIYGICVIIALIAALLETWNSSLASQDENNILHPRFVISAVNILLASKRIAYFHHIIDSTTVKLGILLLQVLHHFNTPQGYSILD
ncbi:unnamed protein product [Thelazia callipaeda]|uniref:DUF4149 domain-containing protein n=1 Tax=Thelazia callipaeda TaxID=103827 RepID=A0A0N5DAJ8_THECL|nr:unnamed protein product [Thelazia callipaeda]